MSRYVVARLLQMLLVVAATTFLIFALVWALPGDPLTGLCGYRSCPPAYEAAMRAKLHLDQPMPVQYLHYVAGLATGDLGQTPSAGSVSHELAAAYPVTVRLAVVAIGFEMVLGLAVGLLGALRHGKLSDHAVLVVTMVLTCIPVFVIGTLLQAWLGVRLQWFPATVSSAGGWGELILPGFVLSVLSLVFVARLLRAELVDNLRADYVRTAIAKGLPRRRVVWHALRNSLIPVVTFIGADFGALLGGAIVVEGIFNIHGVGGLVVRSIYRRESAMVVGVVTVLIVAFLVVNLLVDLLYAALDPRIRTTQAR